MGIPLQSEATQDADFATRNFIGALFSLVVDGKELAVFTMCSGLTINIEKVEHATQQATGGLPYHFKEAGTITYEDVTLERGMTTDTTLTDWVNDWATGLGQRTSCAINLLDATQGSDTIVDTFELENAWPYSMTFSELDASSDDIVTETLILKHEGLKRVPA